jgi:hypothetical protein
MTVNATRRFVHGWRVDERFGSGCRDEMIGNKAGFNDSIEERRVMLPLNGHDVGSGKARGRL